VEVTDSNGSSGIQAISLQVNYSGTVVTSANSSLPAGMAIINISAAQCGNSPPSGVSCNAIDEVVGGNGTLSSDGMNQSLWYAPINKPAGQLLEYTLQPGTYTFRLINPSDASMIFGPSVGAAVDWTAWANISPWGEDYLVFDASAATTHTESQLFSGGAGVPTDGVNDISATAAYNYEITNGLYNNIFVQNRNATPQQTVTFPLMGTGPETVIFSVPKYDLSVDQGGVSLLIAPYTSTPGLTTTSLANGQVGAPYSQNISPTGGAGIYFWTATGLPPGLTLSTTGNPGVLSGTPTHTGNYPIQITVTDPVSGFSSMTPFSVNIAAPTPALTITTTTLPAGEVGVGYSQGVAATGGYGAYTWSISAGAPLSLSSAGANATLSSAAPPTTPGNLPQFTVTVRDAAGDSFSRPYTVAIDAAVSITTSSLPNAAVGESWAKQLTASGGIGSYTWSANGLPAWLSLTAAGVLSGLPPAGTSTSTPFNFSVTVKDSDLGTKTTPLSLQVGLPVGYVAENLTSGGLALAPGDGSSQPTLEAAAVNGSGLAGDESGNAVVATGTALQRITPFGGNVSTVANAPSGSSWVAVAADSFGNLIVGDNVKHGIWRVSPYGLTAVLVASYSQLITNQGQAEDVAILVDAHGNYIVAQDNGSTAGLFSITPAGAITAVKLTGSPLPQSVSGLRFDQNGNYMLLDKTAQALFRITPQGAATVFAGTGIPSGSSGLARNPLTNEYVFGNAGELFKISASGSTITPLIQGGPLTNVSALSTLTEDFPSTVDATNPLAYFRLETASGISEVNGSYSYNLSGNPPVAISSPGAPIGTASSFALLDGSTGEVTTSLTGNINTAGSIMAWVNFTTLPSATDQAFNYVAGESQQGNDFDLQFDSNNALGFYTTNNSARLAYAPPNLATGQWHMIVATFDATAGTRAIYWDGKLAASDNVTSLTNKTGTFGIGNSSLFSGRYFHGGIDEVAVWNYALTASQVYRMFASLPPGTNGTINSLTPASAPLNGSATTLTISGQNFSSDCNQPPCSTVWWTSPPSQGQAGQTTILTPTSVTSSQIQVTIPSQQLTTAGPVQVSVANATGVPANRLPFTVQNIVLTIGGGSTNLGEVSLGGAAISTTYTASGGVSPYTWSVIGTLPPGLTFTAGILSGAPTQAGNFKFSIQVTDSQPVSTQASITLSVLGITSASPLPTATAGSQYSTMLTAAGGTGTYTFSGSGIPAGLSLSSAGVLSGLTTFAGNYTVTVTVTDSNQVSSTSQFGLTVGPSPITITPGSLPNGVVGVAYLQTLSASGGVPPYSWTLAGGATPPGLGIISLGAISGTPTQPGISAFTVMATDSSANGQSNTASFLISIAPALTITTTAIPSGTANQAYGPFTVLATGGSGSDTWTASGFPTGVSIGTTTGTISGTPTAGGSYSVTVTATDTVTQQTASQTYTLSIAFGPLTITAPGNPATIGLGGSVSASFSATGGKVPYTWSASGQPTGVSIGSTGLLSGSPAQAGIFTVSVTVTDAQNNSAAAPITINVLGLTTTSLPNGTAGQFYSASIGATGGTGTYTFSATGLPSGLSLGSNGLLSGTTITNGTFTPSFTVSSAGASASASVNLTIAKPQPLAISSATLPAGPVNVLYSQSLSATGGIPPYTWAVNAGSLPQGISMSASGILSGTPAGPGTFPFGVQVTDVAGATATAAESIVIQPSPVTITTQTLPTGMNGVDYPHQSLAATGGVSPYTWALSSGSALPTGMILSSDGVVSGVPTITGTSSITFSIGVTLTDSATPTASTASATLQLTIRPSSADLILTSSSLGFSMLSPATTPPSSQSVGVQSTVATQLIQYTVSVSPAAPWLTLANGSQTPDSIQASINSTALTLGPGDYQTTITATCTSGTCTGHTQSVSVDINVKGATPELGIDTGVLAFATTTANLATMTQSIVVENTGGGTLAFSTIACETGWCTTGAPPSGLGGNSSTSVPVTVDPSLLSPGFYRTQVDITTSNGQGSVPVTLFIAANSTMTLAPAGQQFNMPAGSSPGNPNGSFLVGVNNATVVNWSAAVLPGASWLVAGTSSGTSSSTQPGTVSFSIDPVAAGALASGAYYGIIEITSTDVTNSPQDFEVVLNVSPAAAPVTPDPEPGGLLFITTVGGVLPPETVTVYSSSATPSIFQASAATTDGNGWLSVTPGTGSSAAGAPGVTTVSVSTTGLSAGVYTGGVSYSLSATAVRTVTVTLIVAPGGGGATSSASSPSASSAAPRAATPQAATCTPSVLVPAQTGLVNSFSAPAGWPTPLTIVLANDCGSVVNNGQVVATFSNGDPPLALPLANPSQGLYSGTWSPAKTASQVSITVSASAQGYPQATSRIAGAVVPNAVPVLAPHGTLHGFYPLKGAALAPGTIVQIYGQNLAPLTVEPSTIPLPTAFNGVSVIIGGMPAPLYYVSPGQINAQIPFELQAGQQYQVIVSANGALTTPNPIQLSPATPGLAALPDGTLIAQHLDGSLASPASPAQSGEYLVAYLAGMGNTTVPVASGTASPENPLALPSNPPVLTINGNAYPIYFAGLTPGLVGLYQMNFQVPAGLPAGDITIVVSQNGQLSNETVLPYQP